MKLKQKEKIKYSSLYDPLCLGISAIFFLFTLAGYLWIIIAKVDMPSGYLRAGVGHLILITWPYILFPIVVFFLRSRVIDQKGISAKFFGIRYKYIRWENLKSYHIENYAPLLFRDKNKRDFYRDAMFFTSYPNSNGKSTVIIVYATDSAYATVKKYLSVSDS